MYLGMLACRNLQVAAALADTGYHCVWVVQQCSLFSRLHGTPRSVKCTRSVPLHAVQLPLQQLLAMLVDK
jgi:hypothetical protein